MALKLRQSLNYCSTSIVEGEPFFGEWLVPRGAKPLAVRCFPVFPPAL
jgi:hypothetical protein